MVIFIITVVMHSLFFPHLVIAVPAIPVAQLASSGATIPVALEIGLFVAIVVNPLSNVAVILPMRLVSTMIFVIGADVTLNPVIVSLTVDGWSNILTHHSHPNFVPHHVL